MRRSLFAVAVLFSVISATAFVSCPAGAVLPYSITDLGTLGGSTSQAYGLALNSSAQVAGASWLPGNTARHAFLWSGGVMSDLGTLPGFPRSLGDGVNDLGDVVGIAYQSAAYDPSDGRAFLYRGGVMTDLGTLGGDVSHSYGVNNTGQVVGMAWTSGGKYHAFLWEGGTMTDLGTLTGSNNSIAYAINGSGEVVGLSHDGGVRAFLWTEGGGMIGLGTLPGYTGSEAHAISNLGDIAGWALSADGKSRAFLYDGTMTDLV